MNLKTKTLLLAVFYGSLLSAAICAVYAYVVISNTVTVTVGNYVLQLSPETQDVRFNRTADFSVLLTNEGMPVENATITLCKGDEIQYSNTTQADGIYTFSILMIDPAGTYYFRADFVVP